MAINVRQFLGLSAKPALLLSIWVSCISPALAQAKIETPQQANDKIQQLAALESLNSEGIPIGTGDLVHIDVFDVPELSRDVRVSDTGDITYPLIPGKIVTVGLTPYQLEQK